MSVQQGWIGVDLDGTLAHYDHWRGFGHIGEPVPAMVDRVKAWIAEGKTVKIFTARVSPAAIDLNGDTGLDVYRRIWEWCEKNIGTIVPVTNEKDMAMVQLWDDRCVQVIPNTGKRADGQE